MTTRKRSLILLFVANAIFLFAGVASADSPPVNNNCGFEVIDITSEAGKIFSNRVDSILDQLYGRSPGPLTALIPSLFVIAIFSLFLDYLKGRLELISFMTRIFIVLLLLGYYNANDKWNYLNIIQNTTTTLADSIKYVTQDGQQMDARTAVWNTFFDMYRNIALESVQPSSKGEKVVRWVGNFIGLGGVIDAAHILGFIVSPAGITSIMFILTTLLVALFSYILDAGADILLMILRLVGPIALCFGLIRSTQHIAWGWLQRFIEVCLWKLVYAIFIVGIATIFERLGQVAFDPSYYQDLDTLTGLQCSFTAMLLSIVVGIVALFMLASIPSICASLVEGRSAGMGTTVSLLLGAAAYGAMSVARRAAASVATRLRGDGGNGSGGITDAVDKQRQADRLGRHVDSARQNYQQLQQKVAAGIASPQAMQKAGEKLGTLIGKHNNAQTQAVAAAARITTPMLKQAADNMKSAERMKQELATLSAAIQKLPDSPLKNQALTALKSMQEAADKAKAFAEQASKHTAATGAAIQGHLEKEAKKSLDQATAATLASNAMLKAARDEGGKLAGLARELGVKIEAGAQSQKALIQDAIDKQNMAASKQREALAAKQELQRVQDLARQGNASPTDVKNAAEKYANAVPDARNARREAVSTLSSVTKPVSAEAKENLKAASQLEKDAARLQSALTKTPDSAMKQEAQKALANTQSATETAKIQVNDARRNTVAATYAIRSGEPQKAQEYMKAAHDSVTSSRASLTEAANHAQKADAIARALGIKPDSDGPAGGTGGPKGSGPSGSGGSGNISGPNNSGFGGSRGSNGSGSTGNGRVSDGSSGGSGLKNTVSGSNGNVSAGKLGDNLNVQTSNSGGSNPKILTQSGSNSQSMIKTPAAPGAPNIKEDVAARTHKSSLGGTPTSKTKSEAPSSSFPKRDSSFTSSSGKDTSTRSLTSAKDKSSHGNPVIASGILNGSNPKSFGSVTSASSSSSGMDKTISSGSRPVASPLSGSNSAATSPIAGEKKKGTELLQTNSKGESLSSTGKGTSISAEKIPEPSLKGFRDSGRGPVKSDAPDNGHSSKAEPTQRKGSADEKSGSSSVSFDKTVGPKQSPISHSDAINNIENKQSHADVSRDQNLKTSKISTIPSGLEGSGNGYRKFNLQTTTKVDAPGTNNYDNHKGQLVGEGFRKLDPRELNLDHPAATYYVNGLKAIKPEPQLTISSNQNAQDPRDWIPSKNFSETHFKPDKGMWTSTFDVSKQSSDRIGSIRKERPDLLSADWQIVIPAESSRVLRIDTPEDASRLLAHPKYSMDAPDEKGRVPNFKAIAQDFDGFSVGRGSANRATLTEDQSDIDPNAAQLISAYDKESTVWFNQAFEEQYSIRLNNEQISDNKPPIHQTAEVQRLESQPTPKQHDPERTKGLRQSVEKVISKLLTKKDKRDER